MSIIYEMVKNVVIYLILITIVMNLLGNSSYKKYVGIFTGMVLILIVITPIMKLINMEDDFGFHLDMEMLNVDAKEIDGELNVAAEERKNVVLSEYKETLKSQISKQLNHLNLEPVNIELTIEEDHSKTEYGEIKQIDIVAKQLPEEENKTESKVNKVNKVNKVSIDKIKIGKEKKKEANQQDGKNKVFISLVKETLAEEYQLKQEQINVEIQ